MDLSRYVATVLTALVITLLAVILWVGISLFQGESIKLLETAMFAFVFAFVYFTGLYLMGGTEN